MIKLYTCCLLMGLLVFALPAMSETRHVPYAEGKIRSVSGNEITITLKPVEFENTPNFPIVKLAEQIILKSLFLEGMNIEIEGVPAVVKSYNGNTLVVVSDEPQIYASGRVLNFKIPKKTIALFDFRVTKGREKNAGRVTIEGLTSELIESAHFTVIERSKLKTVMDELQLGLSGLAKETDLAGLAEADLLVTGTFADNGDMWDINLKLTDARKGLALGVITLKAPFSELLGVKDVSAMNEDFEAKNITHGAEESYTGKHKGKRPPNTSYNSWVLGHRKKGNAYVSIDNKDGAIGSKHSLRMDFDLAALNDEFFYMENGEKRDLTFFSGIEFYVKANRPFTGQFRMLNASRDHSFKVDAWAARFEVGTEWGLVRIPFEELVIARVWIKKGAGARGLGPGSQVLDLGRVTEIGIGVHSNSNPPVEGSMWIDNVRFYRD